MTNIQIYNVRITTCNLYEISIKWINKDLHKIRYTTCRLICRSFREAENGRKMLLCQYFKPRDDLPDATCNWFLAAGIPTQVVACAIREVARLLNGKMERGSYGSVLSQGKYRINDVHVYGYFLTQLDMLWYPWMQQCFSSFLAIVLVC